MATEIVVFDLQNKQKDFLYMAKSIASGDYVIGYVVIDKPWYSPESCWTYYLVNNKYGSGGFCGGATDLGLEKTAVDKSTIEAFTQTAKIKFNQSRGFDTHLIDAHDPLYPQNEKLISIVKVEDTIPYDLWDK